MYMLGANERIEEKVKAKHFDYFTVENISNVFFIRYPTRNILSEAVRKQRTDENILDIKLTNYLNILDDQEYGIFVKKDIPLIIFKVGDDPETKSLREYKLFDSNLNEHCIHSIGIYLSINREILNNEIAIGDAVYFTNKKISRDQLMLLLEMVK